MPIKRSGKLITSMDNSCDHTPAEHRGAKPCRRPHVLQYHVAWYFQQNIRDKEYEKSNIIVITLHVQLLLHAKGGRISDIDPVEEGNSIENE